jgi:hypothetical protein
VAGQRSNDRRRDREIESEVVRLWPAALAVLAVGGVYALLPSSLREGPRWLLPALSVVLVLSATGFRWRGYHGITAWLGRSATVLVTAALVVSILLLVLGLHRSHTTGVELLTYAVLLWVINILVFALWYWEVDAGGPRARHTRPYGPIDFAFPQFQLEQFQLGRVGSEPSHWIPGFVDYLFLAFNTNTAFSPTDTMVMSQRAKLLMMTQAVLALLVFAVLAARAISLL